jgi:Domain of unknown function (DUF4260)
LIPLPCQIQIIFLTHPKPPQPFCAEKFSKHIVCRSQLLLFLAPDLSMAGYLVGKKSGAMFYNSAHTYTVPLLAFLVLWLSGQTSFLGLILIWLAHIGFDRIVGYGLKYETAFKDTHLQRV